MITDEKKKRIESLSDEEMSYEINLGRRSRFQRESFAYLQTCYQKRKNEKEEHEAMMRAFHKVPLAHELEMMPDIELAELQSQLPPDSPGNIIVESEWRRRKSSKIPNTTTTPDFEWYGSISKEKRMTSRCPFATVEVCPRYYQSLSLLPEAGFTGIPDKENAKLLKKWKSSDLWPKIDEQATSVSKSDSRLSTLSNFCPEVLYDSFGYFCTFLSSYADEIDSDMAHRMLHKQGAASNDPRWHWSYAISQHYSECPLFSVLEHRNKNQARNLAPVENNLHIFAPSKLKPVKESGMRAIANLEATTWKEIENDYGVSKKLLGKKINFVTDAFKRKVIFRDIEHAYCLANAGYSKPAVILAGGVTEELLRLYLIHNKVTPSDKTFDSYIKACETNGLLKKAVHRLSDSFRHFRNFVHLSNEITSKHTISKATAKGAVASIFTLANDF